MGFAPSPDQSLPATTTAQEDITTAGQRKVNLIWEYTQAVVALIVVGATMASGVYDAFTHSDKQVPTIMSVAFGTVVGFYFSRTNHQAIGGVGRKPSQQTYEGR
jgi:hypothetical protein